MARRQALIDAFIFRHACKLFDRNKTVHDGDLEYVLEAGRWSPSSLGLEHWKFIVVRDDRLKVALQAACNDQPQVGTASAIIVILAKTTDLNPGSSYVESMFSRYPPEIAHALQGYYRDYSTCVNLIEWSIAQCHIAAANMMTAAAFIDIDSCPIGGLDAAKVIEALAVDAKKFVVAMLLPIGYRVSPPPPRHRLGFSSLVEFR